MEWKDRNKVYEKPTVNVWFSYLFQISYILVGVVVFNLREEVQNNICVEKYLNE